MVFLLLKFGVLLRGSKFARFLLYLKDATIFLAMSSKFQTGPFYPAISAFPQVQHFVSPSLGFSIQAFSEFQMVSK
jgi:hypothetical protein